MEQGAAASSSNETYMKAHECLKLNLKQEQHNVAHDARS